MHPEDMPRAFETKVNGLIFLNSLKAHFVYSGILSYERTFLQTSQVMHIFFVENLPQGTHVR